MKSFALITISSLLVVAALGGPVSRGYYYGPPRKSWKKSVAIGGDAGDGGDAVAVGADVTAGIGGAAVGGTKKNLNIKGKQTGGDGFAVVTAANGAAGIVKGRGTIKGKFENEAKGGNGGNGGAANAY